MRDYSLLTDFLKENGLQWTTDQISQLDLFYERLIETNKVMNLTAITSFPDVLEKHFIDSLAIISIYDLKKDRTVIDVGTGAGFPGIPLKIFFPHLQVVLLDSLQKRVNFLNSIIQELELTDISAVHGRAEDMGHKKEFREQFDLCVSRAVANLQTLSELCLPFVKTGGFFIPYKSASGPAECRTAENAIVTLGAMLCDCREAVIGPSRLTRTFPVISKKHTTAAKYPRKAGTPSKEPL